MAYFSICVGMLYMSRLAASSQTNTPDVLRNDVSSKINKTSPPHTGAGMNADVNMSFSLFSVVDLDTQNQVLVVAGSLTIDWHDPRVSWNSSESSGNSFIQLEEEDVWRPRIGLANGADSMDPIQSNTPVIVFSTGIFRWQRKAIFRVRCKIDIGVYPFDTQFCRLMFSPVLGDMLNITFEDASSIESIFYDDNSEWIIQNITQNIIRLEDGIHAAAVGISLKRQPLFYVISIITPIGLMSLLNPFVFLIPARSGEKLGFIMAVFVSHTMFLNLINDLVPPSVSNLTKFLVAIEVQEFFTVLASIFVIAIHHRKEKAEEVKARKMNMSKTSEESLTSKQPRQCFSMERCLDAVSFVVSLSISCAAFMLLSDGVDLGKVFSNKFD